MARRLNGCNREKAREIGAAKRPRRQMLMTGYHKLYLNSELQWGQLFGRRNMEYLQNRHPLIVSEQIGQTGCLMRMVIQNSGIDAVGLYLVGWRSG
jgi:hypothetical protein